MKRRLLDPNVKSIVDDAIGSTFGASPARAAEDGVVVVTGDPDDRHAISLLWDQACIVRVPPDLVGAAERIFAGLTTAEAFTEEPLQALIDDDWTVLGRSWHHYGSAHTLALAMDRATERVGGDDPRLAAFLDANDDMRSEAGFPDDPAAADPTGTTFYLSSESGQTLAAGNFTQWRGRPSDVGILVDPRQRRRAVGRRLVSAMCADALPDAEVLRYRATDTNTASLALAARLGFVRYGGNYLAVPRR